MVYLFVYLDSLDEHFDVDNEFGDATIFYDWKECSMNVTSLDDTVVIPAEFAKLSIPELRRQLQLCGEIPGPITLATKNVYLKRLTRLNSGTTYPKVKVTSISQSFHCHDFVFCTCKQSLIQVTS